MPSLSVRWRYPVALVASAMAMAVTLVLEPWLHGTVLPPAFAAALFTALLVGRGPGLLNLLVSGVALKYFFLPVEHSLAFTTSSAVRLALFWGLGLPLVWVSAALRGAYEAASAANRCLASMIEDLPNVVFVKDARDLRLIAINRAGEELLGLRREEIIGKTDDELFPPDQAAFFRAHDRRALDERRLVEVGDEPLQTQTRGTRLMHTKKVPILDADGVPRYLLGITEDVTAERQAERERAEVARRMEEVSRAREALVAVVSHDLKNPLSVIQMALGIIAGDLPPGAPARDHLQRAERALERMRRLVRDHLDVALTDAGRLPTHIAAHAPAALVREAADAFAPLAADKGVVLRQRLEHGAADVLCDRERIQQAFSNLIGNALRFTPRGGHIELSAESDADEGVMRFAVADTGAGIAAGDLEHVFDRYWRPPQAGSSGLSLAIVKGIVETHGGRVWIDSAPGRGTRAVFTLPLVDGGRAAPSRPRAVRTSHD